MPPSPEYNEVTLLHDLLIFSNRLKAVVQLLRAECVEQVQGVPSEKGQDPEDNQY